MNFRAGILLAGTLMGCNQQPEQQQAEATRESEAAQILAVDSVQSATDSQPTIALADTLPPYTALENRNPDAPQRVSIGGVLYRVEALAVPDSTKPLRYTYPPEPGAADSAALRTAVGTEVVYTFRLLKPNGQPLFSRQLLKTSLAAEIGEDLAVEAIAWPPTFIGYLPKFNALAFELPVNPPDSDSGGELLLLLDARTGQVRRQHLSRWYGGCNSPVALSENGETLLTSFAIIQANGHVTSLSRPNQMIGGVLFVNNNRVLVTYVPKENQSHSAAPSTRNTRLFDLNGHQLAAFDLSSLDGGLGYRMLATYIRQTKTYYLYDEGAQQLGLLLHDQPTAMRIVKLEQLQKFQPPQHSKEVSFSLNTEIGTQIKFYVDTVTQQVRYHFLRRPNQ